MSIYTSVFARKDNIFLRGYDNSGNRIEKIIKYKPYCFILSKNQSDYKTLDGSYVDKVNFDSISDAKEFLLSYKDIDNFDIYGMTEWPYLFIHDYFPGEIDFDYSHINIGILDVEVEHSTGFPLPELAENEITAITIRNKGVNYTFGYNNFIADKNTKYKKCSDEKDLILKFLSCWVELDIDIVTGWNVEKFDIVYIINRIKNILNEDTARLLSPYKNLIERVDFEGKITYEIQGITTLDYLNLYKKFSFKTLESYKLDDVAIEELGVGKLDFGESSSLSEMYHKDYQRFIEYNIMDCVRVDEIDQKTGLIELIVARAYSAKCKFIDCLGTVKLWDTLVHGFLLDEKKIVVPPFKHNSLTKKLIGGYNKEVVPGMYKWVVGLDVQSEYPNVIMQWNISPETIGERVSNIFKIQSDYRTDTLDISSALFKGKISEFSGENYCISANGFKFYNDKVGFLPELMDKLFTDRKKFQALLKEAKANDDKKLISKYHNRQRAYKDTLNSGYGALASPYYRWFNFDLAEAITSTGQFTIRTVGQYVNNYLNKILKTNNIDYLIASDTDSGYFSLGPLVEVAFSGKEQTTESVIKFIDKFCNEKLLPEINKCLIGLAKHVGAKTNKINMSREIIADKAIWTAKKHYILNLRDEDGIKLDKPKLKVRGIESVRSSTPMIVRDAIKDTLFKIMNEDEESVKKFVIEFREKFMQSPFEIVAFPRSVSGIKKYASKETVFSKGSPIQVKGALLYNFLLKKYKLDKILEPIQEGNKIKFTYLREPNIINSNVIASPGPLPKEFNLDNFIDHDMQFEKSYMDPITKITDIIGWNIGSSKASLEDFFA